MNTQEKEKLQAAIDFIRRTGARQIQVRYSDDEQPVIWFVVAVYSDGRTEVDAASDPLQAGLRLAERLADGGKCTHCNRPVGLEPNLLVSMPFDQLICWYQYDPEMKTFRRGCE